MRRDKGITLIELLVVLLVMLTLLLVATPHVINSRTRAKVARVQQNMMIMESALEWFYLDHKRYPTEPEAYLSNTTHDSSTAISFLQLNDYMESVPEDPFRLDKSKIHGYPIYEYGATTGKVTAWVLVSPGPDRIFDTTSISSFPFGTTAWEYSPFNGLKSEGDILRYGGDWELGNWWLDGAKVGLH